MIVRYIGREFRQQHGVKLRELARGTHLRPSTISELERGVTKGIDFETLNRIVAYYRARGIICQWDNLLSYEPDPPAGEG